MDFRILGPLEVLDEDRTLALAGSKPRTLLALLLLHAGETLTSDRLSNSGERAERGQRRPVRRRARGERGGGRSRHAADGERPG